MIGRNDKFRKVLKNHLTLLIRELLDAASEGYKYGVFPPHCYDRKGKLIIKNWLGVI